MFLLLLVDIYGYSLCQVKSMKIFHLRQVLFSQILLHKLTSKIMTYHKVITDSIILNNDSLYHLTYTKTCGNRIAISGIKFHFRQVFSQQDFSVFSFVKTMKIFCLRLDSVVDRFNFHRLYFTLNIMLIICCLGGISFFNLINEVRKLKQ